MGAIKSMIDLLRYGSEVADPEAWKKGQINVNKIVTVLAAVVVLLRSFGVVLPIDDAGIVAVAGGVFALANMVFTAITSSRAGLLPRKVQPEPLPTLDSDGDKPTDWKSVAERDFNAERG